MSRNNSGKIHQFTQIHDQLNSSKDKEDPSSATFNKTRYDTILDNLEDTLLSGSSKWVQMNHIGTQTTPHEAYHRRNVVRSSNYKSISSPLLESKRPEKERVIVKASEDERNGMLRGKKIKNNTKSNSHPLRTDRKRKDVKRLKMSDTSTANRTMTESSRTIRGQVIGPGSSNRVRKKRTKRSSTRKSRTIPKDPNRSTHTMHQSTDSSSRIKSIKTLYKSKFSNAFQSDTTFLDVSHLSEIGQSLLPDTSSNASNCMETVPLPDAGAATTTTMECSGETTTLTENEKTSTEMPLENIPEDPPTSSSGAGDFYDIQMQSVSPYQSSLDYNTDHGSITTDSTLWSYSSPEDVSPKSSLLSFSGEVLRMRYSNPRLVLNALKPSGERPKWPFSNKRKAMEVTCKAHDDMVFLFDSQYCDNALACWEKISKAKYRKIQRKSEVNSRRVTPKTSSAPRNTTQPSKRSTSYSKPLNSETGISVTDFGPSLTAINSFSPSGRHSITYCSFQDFMYNQSSYTFENSTSTYTPRWTSVKDTSIGSLTSREKNVGSCDKLCVGHNTCLDLTQGLPTAAGDAKLSSHLRNGKFMQTQRNDSFLLQGDSVWRTKNTSPPRSVDPTKKSPGREEVGKKFSTTIRTTGEREIFVRTNKEARQGNAAIECKGGTNGAVSAIRTSRGNTGLLENGLLAKSCGGESGIWEIGADIAQFAGNTIVISKPDKGGDPFLSKTEPLLLGHFRSGVRRKNIATRQKITCSAGPSVTMSQEPRNVNVDTTLATARYGASVST